MGSQGAETNIRGNPVDFTQEIFGGTFGEKFHGIPSETFRPVQIDAGGAENFLKIDFRGK